MRWGRHWTYDITVFLRSYQTVNPLLQNRKPSQTVECVHFILVCSDKPCKWKKSLNGNPPVIYRLIHAMCTHTSTDHIMDFAMNSDALVLPPVCMVGTLKTSVLVAFCYFFQITNDPFGKLWSFHAQIIKYLNDFIDWRSLVMLQEDCLWRPYLSL